MTCSNQRAIKKPACRHHSAAGMLPLKNNSALAADELLHLYPLDVPLAFAGSDPQNPSSLMPPSGLQSTKAGARLGFLGRIHRKNLTPSVVLSCLANKVKKKRHLLESFLIFRSLPVRFTFSFRMRTAYSQAGHPAACNLPRTTPDNSSADSLFVSSRALPPPFR